MAASKRMHYPPNLTNQELNPAVVQFQFYKRKGTKNSVKAEEINLYMPDHVSQPSTVSWDTASLGWVGAKAAGVMGSQQFKQAVDSAQAGDWANKIKQTAKAFGTASVANAVGGSVDANAVMGVTQAQVPNPYLAMVFRGVNFRDFSFVFKFTPFTKDDTKMIDDIIRTFRANSLPEGKGGQNQTFFGYPHECEIKYMWMGEENKHLHKFKRAVCTGIDIDYTGQGMFSVMRDGMPANIVVSTKWSEIELVLSDDVRDNY